jgi:uncharacterized protein (DUF2252 family)
MLTSPFAFLRGSAVIMASDLASTPVAGPRVQACGDAHLGNFGVFATLERNLIFDVNDFRPDHRGQGLVSGASARARPAPRVQDRLLVTGAATPDRSG